MADSIRPYLLLLVFLCLPLATSTGCVSSEHKIIQPTDGEAPISDSEQGSDEYIEAMSGR